MKYLLPLFFIFCWNTQLLAQDISDLSYPQIDSILYVYLYSGEHQKGIDLSLKVVEHIGKEDSLQGEYYSWVAYYYQHKDDPDNAQKYYDISNRIFREVQGEISKRYAEGLGWQASFCKIFGLYEKAIELYQTSLEIKKQLYGEAHNACALDYNYMGLTYVEMGLLQEAILVYEKAKKIYTAVHGPDYYKLGTIYNNIAMIHHRLGEFEETEALLKKAIAVFENGGVEKMPGEYANTYNNLGALYSQTNELDEAAFYIKKSLNLYLKFYGDQHPYTAYAFYRLGALYIRQKQADKALELFKRSKVITRKVYGYWSSEYADILYKFGQLYYNESKFDKALKQFREVAIIQKKILGNHHLDYMKTLGYFAAVFRKNNQLDSARYYAMQAIDLNATNFEDYYPNLVTNTASTAWENIAYEQLTQLEYQLPIKAQESISELVKISYKAIEQQPTPALLEQYYTLSKVGITLNTQIKNSFSNNKNKLRLIARNVLFLETGIEAALRLESKEKIVEAFSFAEQNKSILLEEALKGNRAQVLSDLPDSLIFKEQKLQKQKEALKIKRIAAQTEAEKEPIITKEIALNKEIDAFLKMLQQSYPKYHQLKYKNISANAKDIQTTLDEGSMLLEFISFANKTYLFAVSKKEIDVHTINVTADSLNHLVDKFHRQLSDYKYIVENKKNAFKNYTAKAYYLYDILLSEALQDSSISNLIIIADGQLGYLPFETFLVEKAPQQKENYQSLHYLLNDYNISYNYSATLWKENLAQKSSSPNHQLLACAATYPPTDSSLSTLRSPYSYKLRKVLRPLPAAEDEVKQLSQTFQGDFIIGSGVSESFFKKEASNYGVIHLAMHGVLHPNIPMLSSLAFTENQDSLEDNFLQAHEISHLNLQADLVVLSACETGFGKFEQGEGVLSLARSFMYAGVPSLVVSLWQVNDQSTAFIMKAFYKHLAEGLPKDQALRKAKQAYINNSEGVAGHPAFWSAFIQLGDNKAIQLDRKTTIWVWLLGGGVLLLLMGGLFLLRKRKRSA